MFDTEIAAPLDRLQAALSEVLESDFTSYSPDVLVEMFQKLETVSRIRESVQHRVVAEIDSRGIAFDRGSPSVPHFLRTLVAITPPDAKRRYAAAMALAPRRTLSGEPLPPIYARTAAAHASGAISADHARLIVATIERLPDAVAADHDLEIEAALVGEAIALDPRQLGLYATRLVYRFDQDGLLATEAYRNRHRAFTIAQRPDGSAHVDGELTAPCAEALLTVLDSLAKPAPAIDGTRDARTPAERRHDGLLDAMLRLLRDGGLPMTGGTHATILLTITETQLQARAGLVTTGHGAIISVDQAIAICTDLKVLPVIFDDAHAITYYGNDHRTATVAQRLALAARDHGCSFPDCDTPAAWCETHHVHEFHHGGKTSLKNLTLLCGYHHREFQRLGWLCTITNGIPLWTPPHWVDPQRTPRRNHAHL